MSQTLISHRPDPEFTKHLEWQVRTELRRKERFDVPAAGPRAPWKWARVGAIAVLAMALGAGSVLAAQRLQRSREAESKLVSVQVRQHMAAGRLEFAREERDSVARQVEGGSASTSELAEHEHRVASLQLELERLELDASEVAATGRDPSDHPSAPAVGGRDYVSARLALRARIEQVELRHAEERVRSTVAAHEHGFVSKPELDRRQGEVAAAERALAVANQKLAVRAGFMRGQTSAVRAELEGLRIDAESTLQGCREAVENAREEVGRVRLLAERGLALDSEDHAAQQSLAEAQAAVELAELELTMIDERIRK